MEKFCKIGSSTTKFCNTSDLYSVKNPLDWSEVNNTLILPGDLAQSVFWVETMFRTIKESSVVV